MPHARVAHIRVVHVVTGVEAVDLLHQVEHHAEHVEIVTPGDEARVRHRRACESLQCRDLAQHRLVARRTRVNGRPTQHHRTPIHVHPHHYVLRATGKWLDTGDRRPQALLTHPALHRSLVVVAQCR
jgi:hypothetical protein